MEEHQTKTKLIACRIFPKEHDRFVASISELGLSISEVLQGLVLAVVNGSPEAKALLGSIKRRESIRKRIVGSDNIDWLIELIDKHEGEYTE